jgi:uncharacterized delta-60 repeat protein
MTNKLNQRGNLLPSAVFEPLESRQMFAAGDLDTFFSTDGKNTLNVPDASVVARDVAVQADGKSVVVGTAAFKRPAGTIRRIIVARFNADGSIDTTFGPSGNGMTIFGVGNKNRDSGNAVAIGLDGKIVVAGEAEMNRGGFLPHDFAVARLLPDGTLDRSFDGDGKRTVRVKGDSRANDVVVLPDGKVLIAGEDINGGGLFSTPDFDFAVARLTIDGALDKTFAGGGKRIIGLGEHEFANAVAIDFTGVPGVNPNFGKIILAGERTDFDDRNEYAIVRLTADGVLDKTFSNDGSVVGRFPGYRDAFVRGVTVQASGKIAVAGHAVHGGAGDDTPMTLARFRTNGSIDTTFGLESTGVAYVDFNGKDVAGDVMTSASGGLIIAGTSDGKFALAAFTRDGLLDDRFGFGGKKETDFAPNVPGGLVRMARAPGKRIVVAGGSSFRIARYLDIGAFKSGVKNIDVNSLQQLTVDPNSPPPSGPVILMGTAPARPSLTGRIFSQIRL